jgi:hypothetical protein
LTNLVVCEAGIDKNNKIEINPLGEIKSNGIKSNLTIFKTSALTKNIEIEIAIDQIIVS